MNIDERYNSNFLYFEEKDHRYTDTLGNEYLSVTTLIGKYHDLMLSIGLELKLKNKVKLKNKFLKNGIELKMRLVIEELKNIMA